MSWMYPNATFERRIGRIDLPVRDRTAGCRDVVSDVSVSVGWMGHAVIAGRASIFQGGDPECGAGTSARTLHENGARLDEQMFC